MPQKRGDVLKDKRSMPTRVLGGRERRRRVGVGVEVKESWGGRVMGRLVGKHCKVVRGWDQGEGRNENKGNGNGGSDLFSEGFVGRV